MPEPDEKKEKLHQLVDQELLHPSQAFFTANNVFVGVEGKANAQGVWDPNEAVEYWWHLARIGVIAIPGDRVDGASINHLVLTARGKDLLEKKEDSPHDIHRYITAVKNKVTHPDDVVMAYLTEAVETWGGGSYRSSAVMLGCACEKLVLLLASAIVGAKVGPYDTRLGKALTADKPAFISGLFRDVREALQALAAYKKLPTNLTDAIDRRISSIFDHARGLRNDVGHPTGIEVTADDAEAGLLLFPGFYEYVDQIISHLKGKP